jgi:hypothetical protein
MQPDENVPHAPWIPDFDTWRADGRLYGKHRASGDLIEAETPRQLMLLAMARSVAHTWREAANAG